VGTLILMYFLAIFAFAQFEATLALFTQTAFNMSIEDNFLVFATVGVVLTVAGGMYRPLAKKQAEKKLLTAGVGLMILGLMGLAIVAYVASLPDPPNLKLGFYASMSVAVVGFAFV